MFLKKTKTFKAYWNCTSNLGDIFFMLKNGKLSFDKKYLPVIILVFIGQGIADSTLKWAQEFAINASNNNVFFATTFFTAAFSGTLFMMIQLENYSKP